MPADSIRERLLATHKTLLEGIIGGDDYHYGPSLRRVERYVHTYDGTEHETNIRAEAPSISIRVLNETGALSGADDVAIGEARITLTEEVWFALRDRASDTELNRAIADMKKALFQNFDGWGGITQEVSWEIELVDPETGAPVDGAKLVIESVYNESLGDPTT